MDLIDRLRQRWQRWQWQRQRLNDRRYLWPALLEETYPDEARATFRLHVETDPAYSELSAAERDQLLQGLSLDELDDPE